MSGIRRPAPADRGGAQRSAGSGTSACSIITHTQIANALICLSHIYHVEGGMVGKRSRSIASTGDRARSESEESRGERDEMWPVHTTQREVDTGRVSLPLCAATECCRELWAATPPSHLHGLMLFINPH
jgi:hypothetical protein